MSSRINEKTIRSLVKPSQGSNITYDSEVKGFGFRLGSTGSASFILNYRIDGRERRITIGQYPVWSMAKAREQASKLRLMADNGIDPLSQRVEKREAWTVRDLSEEYQRVHVPNMSSVAQKDVGVMWASHNLSSAAWQGVKRRMNAWIFYFHRTITVQNQPFRWSFLMRSLSRFAMLPLLFTAVGSAACAAAPAPLSVMVEGITDGKRMPDTNAACLATKDGKSDPSGKNLRPTISWSNAPATAKSFAIFVMDPDVPADFTDAGKEGKTLPVSAKRKNFFHYAVINIPVGTTSFPGGVPEVNPTVGMQLPNDMGANKYVATLEQFGGPCPPWNDERLHHYHFMVLALDTPADNAPTADLSLMANSAYEQLSKSPHLVAKGEVVGTYSLNPKMK